MQARADGNDARCVERLEHALDLYRGDFLADEPYAEWAMAERDRLRALAAEALRTLADIRLAEHDDEAAIAHLQRLVELDPFDVNVQRRVIALCLRSGRRSEAMRRYATLRQRLMATFGEVPDFDLAQLASEQGDRPPAPAA
jgi:DNA-binding SARP family transcriptional activator